MYDYTGIIHFHSEYSFDGRAAIPEIIEAAKENGIGFLMLTDHFHLMARERGEEGWHGNVLLIVGEEISPRYNHYLAFGLKHPLNVIGPQMENPQYIIDQVRSRGGLGFIAHPDHRGTEMFHVKPYCWNDWSVQGYAGLGIWDFMTDWQSGLNGYLSGLYGFLFPALALKGPRPETLQRWDEIGQSRRVVGIGELDNHDSSRDFLGFKLSVFPFSKAFRLISTHVLTDATLSENSEEAIGQVLNAIGQGRAYVSNEYFMPASGFEFVLECGELEVPMGQEVDLPDGAALRVKVPQRARIRLLRNGRIIRETAGCQLRENLEERGVYRCEAHLRVAGKYRPWIFSNPIYVR